MTLDTFRKIIKKLNKISLKFTYIFYYIKLLNYKGFKVLNKKITLHSFKKSKHLKDIFFYGMESHEKEVLYLLKNLKWDYSHFIDVGANIGYFSMLVEIYSSGNCKVISVEPLLENVKYLSSIKTLNNFRFEIVSKALSRKEGKSIYFKPIKKHNSYLSTSGSLLNKNENTNVQRIDIETTTLKKIIPKDSKKILIKLDCEGSEFDILNSSQSLLKNANYDFIIEILINDIYKEKIFKIMKKNGYFSYLLTNEGVIKESNLITIPSKSNVRRTYWRNHFFSKNKLENNNEIHIL